MPRKYKIGEPKQCPVCKRTKPYTPLFFYRRGKGTDGGLKLYGKCKSCYIEEKKHYYEKKYESDKDWLEKKLERNKNKYHNNKAKENKERVLRHRYREVMNATIPGHQWSYDVIGWVFGVTKQRAEQMVNDALLHAYQVAKSYNYLDGWDDGIYGRETI